MTDEEIKKAVKRIIDLLTEIRDLLSHPDR